MMTLEEAIEHAKAQAAKLEGCPPCAEEHLQLAAWLTELLALRLQVGAMRSDLLEASVEIRKLADEVRGYAGRKNES